MAAGSLNNKHDPLGMSGAAYIDADDGEPLPEVNADRLLTLFLC